MLDHVVHSAIDAGVFGAHDAVTIGVACDLLAPAAGVLGYLLGSLRTELQDFLALAFHLQGRTTHTLRPRPGADEVVGGGDY